jgi:Zn ribbon nucleic-acid-binding protein
MMLVYLEHPDHGVHIAYSKVELEECLQNGWKVREEKKEVKEEPQRRKVAKAK